MSYLGKLGPKKGAVLGGMPDFSSGSSDIRGDIRGEISFTLGGVYTFVVPDGVSNVSIVAVGAGGGGVYRGTSGGGGGALCYINGLKVTSGNIFTITVPARTPAHAHGGDSIVVLEDMEIMRAGGGKATNNGGVYSGITGVIGYYGKPGYCYSGNNYQNVGGGAGNYSETGGGGATGGTPYGGGGGVGIYGQTTTAVAASLGGSGGENGNSDNVHSGGNYGGGSGGDYWAAGTGGGGAVRIIWGEGRAFPSTDCGQS